MIDPLRTPLCELLGIDVPIALAPMANGPSTPELAGAVSGAGGLGCLALAGLTAEQADAQVRRARELAGGAPVAVNVQIPPPRSGSVDRDRLAPTLSALGARVGAAAGPMPGGDPPQQLVAVALAAGAAAVSVALGDPGPYVEAAHRAGVPLIASTSSVAEARRAAAAGADVLVVEGAEAGGHRTTFDVDGAPLPLVGTMALVPRTVDAVDVPVLAAGGIMDGRGVAAALALGAQGAWLGTRFLLAAESGCTPAQRALLAELEDTGTFVTDAITGRPARWVRNALTTMLDDGPGHLGWPGQRAEVGALLRAAAAGGDPDLAPLLAGQGGGMVAAPEPAGDIVRAVAELARAILGR
jgi:nitronate monooxygenase